MALARAEGTAQRFYSLSTQIQRERKQHYDQLEATQHGAVDVTPWLSWFLACLLRAVQGADGLLGRGVLGRLEGRYKQFAVPLSSARRAFAIETLSKSQGLFAMCVQPSGSYSVSAKVMVRGSSANFAAIVGLPRVSFLIVRSSALSLASRKLFADL